MGLIEPWFSDTATGQCWSKSLGDEWRDEGTPLARNDDDDAHAQKPLKLTLERGTQLTIRQRMTKAIPHTNERVRIAIDDITEGQVLLSVLVYFEANHRRSIRQQ